MKGLKSLSLFLSILLIFFAILIILSFFGNPISRIVAEVAADKYLETHYTDLDLVRERAYYDFKDSSYVVRLQDKNSIDTNFNLRFNSFGKMKRDTYGDRLFNTYRRYIDFLYDLGEEIAKDSGLDFEIWLRPDNDFDYKEYLTLDQDFDKDKLPSKVTADFKAYAEKPALEDLMDGLKKVYEALKTRNIAASSYSGLVIPNRDKKEDGEAEICKNAVSVNDVPEKVIVDGDMEALKRRSNQ
ncbi:hypothetical protein [uncultured Fenollaria sp.]|uniref:YfjL-like protein n=1 Tax=uncultured Fenollaria sp. TaxID=1686315 RepID=UPI0025F2C30B|nr:hypothetical protein [uncultured Fenollaria sp.]